jgi:DNA-binding NtrC family response regulator
VRELVNAVERETITSPGLELVFDDLEPATDLPRPSSAPPAPADGPLPTLEEMERSHIRRALEVTDGKISGKGGAAEMLDINPNTLRSRMKKLGIARESAR